MADFACPSCGAELGKQLQYSKAAICEYCQSCLFLEDESVRNIGKMAVLTEMPSLLAMHQPLSYRGWQFTPLGRVRYEYSRGWWDEWWCMDGSGNSKWISVDEGDVAIEEPADLDGEIPACDNIEIGAALVLAVGGEPVEFIVTEKDSCRCIGGEGELPFPISPDDAYDYIDLSAPGARIYTLEFHAEAIQCYQGVWVDPFDIIKV